MKSISHGYSLVSLLGFTAGVSHNPLLISEPSELPEPVPSRGEFFTDHHSLHRPLSSAKIPFTRKQPASEYS
jgi:hypothetical protein